MGLKIVKNFDASFTLEPQAETTLFNLLGNPNFMGQICQTLKETKLEFTRLIFQPVPYSQNTPRGMPREFERYHNCDEFIIINVPPNFMFQARIFQPSRLCAIYRRTC